MASELKKYTPLIRAALNRAEQNGVYAVIRLQNYKGLNIKVLDGNTQRKSETLMKGIGVSVFTKDGTSGFASTSRLEESKVLEAIDIATNLAKASQEYSNVKKNNAIFDVPRLNEEIIQKTKYDFEHKTADEIELIVKKINSGIQSLDDKLSGETSFISVIDKWRIARSDGTDVVYSMPRSLLITYLTLKDKGRIAETHFKIQGLDMRIILDDKYLSLFKKKEENSVNLIGNLLNAGTLKGGNYKVLLSYDFAGLNAHEAVGHAFETDSIKDSIIGNLEGKIRLGEKVAPRNISFIDGPMEGLWGSQFISSNGIERKTVEFIKDGVVNDGLSDVFSAAEAGVNINGCGRAESFSDVPIARMSATRMVDKNPYPFDKPKEDITLDNIYNLLVEMGELKPGEKIVYPVVGMGGQVNPSTGTFVFNCAGIYIFENPKKITLCRQSLFSGNILGAISTRTKGIGKVIVSDAGTCGKMGQGAPVSDGGNLFILIDKTPDIIFGGKR